MSVPDSSAQTHGRSDVSVPDSSAALRHLSPLGPAARVKPVLSSRHVSI